MDILRIHPILDMNYFMLIHYTHCGTLQPLMDVLCESSKLVIAMSAKQVNHSFLKQCLLSNDTSHHMNDYSQFVLQFCNQTSEIICFTRVQLYLKQKVMDEIIELYVYKLKHFLQTSQHLVCFLCFCMFLI